MGGVADDRNAIGTAVLILAIVLVVCYMCLSLYKIETPRGAGSLAGFRAMASMGPGVWIGPREWSGFAAAPDDEVAPPTASPAASPASTPQVDPPAGPGGGDEKIVTDGGTPTKSRRADIPFIPTTGTDFPGSPRPAPPSAPHPSPPSAPHPSPPSAPRPAPPTAPRPTPPTAPVPTTLSPGSPSAVAPDGGSAWPVSGGWWPDYGVEDDYWCESGECDETYLNADACCDTLDVPPPIFY